MDENDLELLLANNLSIEIDSVDDDYYDMDGDIVRRKHITVNILYKGKVISTDTSTV